MNISLSVDEALVQRLDHIAKVMKRSRSWIAHEAMEQYVSYQEWFIASVEQAIAEADSAASFLPHESVASESEERIARLRS